MTPDAPPPDLVAGRDCGGCVECCRVLQINDEEIQKPAGKLCPQNSGAGCGIYDRRPGVCRGWFCGWRKLGYLPEDARPDRSGVIVNTNREDGARNCFERNYVIVRGTRSGEDFQGPAAQAVVDALIRRSGLPVWLGYEDSKTLVHPREKIAHLILNGTPPPDHLSQEVADWRQRLGPA